MLPLDKKILRNRKEMNKRALSEVIGYVLLITIAIALSIIVYGWLKFRVNLQEEPKCPEELSIVVKNYSVVGSDLILTVQNKGFFTVDGFIVKVHNRAGVTFGLYVLNDTGSVVEPGNEFTGTYSFSGKMTPPLTFIEVQPFIFDKSGKVVCTQIATRRVQ